MSSEQDGPGEPPAGPAGQRLGYRLITGPDDSRFCQRVSDAIEDGYVLHGSPSITIGPEGPVVCQAVVLP